STPPTSIPRLAWARFASRSPRSSWRSATAPARACSRSAARACSPTRRRISRSPTVRLIVPSSTSTCGSPRAASARSSSSPAMQQASQIDEPYFAPLLDDMFFVPGAIPFDRFIAPRVEVELAFVLARPLRGPGVKLADVLAATDHVTPAVEIIDARIEQFD